MIEHFGNASKRTIVVVVTLLVLLAGTLLAIFNLDPARSYSRHYEFLTPAKGLVPVLGAVTIGGHDFVVVVDETDLVGRLYGQPVYEVTGVELMHVPKAASGAVASAEKLDTDTIQEAALVEEYLEQAGFYFSPPPLDFSLNFECTTNTQSCSKDRLVHFVANQHMLEQLAKVPNNGNFVKLSAIRGFVEMTCLPVDDDKDDDHDKSPVCASIVSRTSSKRTSTRFSSRGADSHGNVSNFVETEMAVSRASDVAALVQIRGSIPFLWGQQPSLTKTSPPIEVGTDDAVNERLYGNHMDLMKRLYKGKGVGMVSLVDQLEGKNEHQLGKMFSQLADKIKGIPLLAFDYHHEHAMDKSKWFDKLLDKMRERLLPKLTFSAKSKSSKASQTTIIRTNCVDCLDRTNAVQSTFAKHLLADMLASVMKTRPSQQTVDKFTQRIGVMWSHNANAISLQYAGSPALKTDIAKTGRRTSRGRWHDLRATVKRYFNANWFDKARKRAMETVFGPASVDQEPTNS